MAVAVMSIIDMSVNRKKAARPASRNRTGIILPRHLPLLGRIVEEPRVQIRLARGRMSPESLRVRARAAPKRLQWARLGGGVVLAHAADAAAPVTRHSHEA